MSGWVLRGTKCPQEHPKRCSLPQSDTCPSPYRARALAGHGFDVLHLWAGIHVPADASCFSLQGRRSSHDHDEP